MSRIMPDFSCRILGNTMETLLQVTDLHTYYGSSHVLFGISLEVRRGEVVVLLGRNGAGKTTTLKSIMGVHQSRSGSVKFQGEDIAGLDSDRHLSEPDSAMSPRTPASSKVSPSPRTSKLRANGVAEATPSGTKLAFLICSPFSVKISSVEATP